MREFELIERIHARARARGDVILGIGDDAAVLRVPAGKQLVVAMDTLNAGVHFPVDTDAADIGWKSLAVNLSDLAAMAAQPAWCTLSLSLPQADGAWLDAFLDGFLGLANLHDVALVGGDTTRGPLSVCVTVHGLVDEGRALRRDGARPGNEVWITGTLGDGAGALVQWREGMQADPVLRSRLDRPTPRVEAGLALAGFATSAIDVSDGLLADLGHLCQRSGVGAQVDIARLPASGALRAAFDDNARRRLQASGGDDYELCFTAPSDAHAEILRVAEDVGLEMTRIGRVTDGEGVRAVLEDDREWMPENTGYTHFQTGR